MQDWVKYMLEILASNKVVRGHTGPWLVGFLTSESLCHVRSAQKNTTHSNMFCICRLNAPRGVCRKSDCVTWAVAQAQNWWHTLTLHNPCRMDWLSSSKRTRQEVLPVLELRDVATNSWNATDHLPLSVYSELQDWWFKVVKKLRIFTKARYIPGHEQLRG